MSDAKLYRKDGSQLICDVTIVKCNLNTGLTNNPSFGSNPVVRHGKGHRGYVIFTCPVMSESLVDNQYYLDSQYGKLNLLSIQQPEVNGEGLLEIEAIIG